MSCFAIDVGNTSTTMGIVEGDRIYDSRHVRGGIDNLATVEKAIRSMLRKASVPPAGAALSSVVPEVNRRWSKLVGRMLGTELMIIDCKSRLAVGIDYPKPETIGADRLANACGAVVRYGAPVIVADFGTALTFDVVSASATYIGGVIAPGLPLMTEYLADRTALLPLINPKGPCAKTGRSTEDAMRIGARIGYRGMVREIVAHLTAGLGADMPALCATGGYAEWVLKGSNLPFTFDPGLTLRGIGVVFELR